MDEIKILGAGMAGLLAGCMLMNRHNVTVLEAAPSLPSNHHALLRFRSNIVGLTLGTPFKEVEVCKVISGSENPLSDSVRYSMKVNGKPSFRSIIGANGNVEKRYIAPPDLIPKMAKILGDRVKFNQKITSIKQFAQFEPVITTAPMPINIGLVDGGAAPSVEFKSRQGVVVSTELQVDWDFYATVYFPDPVLPYYRASITGKTLIVEYAIEELPSEQVAKNHINFILEEMGLQDRKQFEIGPVSIKSQPRAKIVEIDDQFRKRTIIKLSSEFGLYSLGRFATWRPKLLLDDIVNDVRVIESMIDGNINTVYSNLKR